MRKYPVDLPFTVPAWAVGSLVNVLIANDAWQYLTPRLGNRINEAVKAYGDLILTREELDELPDRNWAAIEQVIPDTMRAK